VNDPSSSAIELLSFIIGIAGIALSAFFYVRSKERPTPVSRSASIPLIGGESPLLPSDVEILYRGSKVQSLSKAYVALWNAGRGTLLESSVVAEDPITFKIEDLNAKVLSARIVRKTREVDKAELMYNESGVRVSFDFFDPQDGIILEVIHTGVNSYLTCTGTIRGVPQGVRALNGSRRRWGRSARRDPVSKPLDYVPVTFLRRTTQDVSVSVVLVVTSIMANLFGISMFASTKSWASAAAKQSVQSQSSIVTASDVYATKVAGLIMFALSLSLLLVTIRWQLKVWTYRLPKKLILREGDISDRLS
jgi:hypothetical protein